MNELNDEPSSYLIPEIFDEDELDLYLDRIWVLLFESLLAQWSTDESLWPKKRSKKMFSEWFDITLHSLVHDLWSKEKLGYSDY